MSKKLVLLLLLIAAYLLLNSFILSSFDEHLVVPYLSVLKYDWINWLMLAVIELFVVQWIFLWRNQQRVGDIMMAASAFLFVNYIYFRFLSSRYVFYCASWSPEFKYADVTLVVLPGIIAMGLLERMRRNVVPVYQSTPFEVDIPITTGAFDMFNRDVFAQRMSDRIQSKLKSSAVGSLAIGVTGNWGSGKTSFLNMIKCKLDDSGRLVIDFNPWRSSTSGKIISDFFDQLTSELARFDPKLSREVCKYAERLKDIEDGWISKSIKAGSDFVFGEAPAAIDYEGINASLAEIGKQIIIFIDDVDRLENKEIMEVLKIVRNTASFVNLVYVVAYDRQYVIEGLAKLNSHRSDQYLEKIFQYEFNLPAIETQTLRNVLRKILKDALKPYNKHVFIDKAVDYLSASGTNFTDRLIVTPREVVRFTNAFNFEIEGILTEINIVDFYLVQLLKLTHFRIFSQLAAYRDVFFVKESNKMRLRLVGEKFVNFQDLGEAVFGMDTELAPETKAKTWFEYYLSEVEKLPQMQVELLNELVEELLVEKSFRVKADRSDYKSFVYAANFDKYFMIQGLASELSYREFEEARLGGIDHYRKMVRTWSSSPVKKHELERRLAAITDYDSLQEWENHIAVLIDLAKMQAKRGIYSVNYKQILEAMAYPGYEKKEKALFGSKKAYHDYIAGFFANAPMPSTVEAQVLVAALPGVTDFPLSTEEIEDQLFKYFSDYCAAHDKITEDFRTLHRSALKWNNSSNRQYPIQERADELFFDYLRTNLTACDLGSFIEKYADPYETYYKFDEDWIVAVFGKKEKLIEHVSTAQKIDRESDCYKEFMSFYQATLRSEFPAILFKLPHLKKDEIDGMD